MADMDRLVLLEEVFGDLLPVLETIVEIFLFSCGVVGALVLALCTGLLVAKLRTGKKKGYQTDWCNAIRSGQPGRRPLRLYMDVGVFENHLLWANRHMRNVLRAKGYDVTYQEFSGGHSSTSWRGTLSDGLKVLLGPGN